ncbi:MAG TPA: hypothetical protein VN426_02120, partial [Syntrophomonadaceae bacterium]|nr:hypothetical protein [Syntrophomonadaceae bacterium]
MNYSKKGILVIGLSTLLVIGFILLNHNQYRQTKVDKNGVFKYDSNNLEDSEKVIRDAFQYKNDHNLNKLREC